MYLRKYDLIVINTNEPTQPNYIGKFWMQTSSLLTLTNWSILCTLRHWNSLAI